MASGKESHGRTKRLQQICKASGEAVEAPTKCVIRYPLTEIFAERQRVSENGLRTLQRSKDTVVFIVILGGTVKDMRLLPRLVGRAFFIL